MSELTDTFIEIELKEPDDFLKIRETLTRIGIANNSKKELYQTCHILHKKGRYYIVHFKELFLLDGKESTFSEDDLLRRNTIANLLEDWDLLKILNPEITEFESDLRDIKVIHHKEKQIWTLIPKYTIGKPATKETTSEETSPENVQLV